MEAPLVVEILDRFGKVRERHRLERFPVRIGRAYDNDIILDDPYVSENHVEILRDGDGHTLITDLKSDNGMFSLHPLQRHDVINLHNNLRIRIGHTDLRFRSTTHPVRETYIDRGTPSRLHFILTTTIMLPVIWLLAGLIMLGMHYLQSSHDVSLARLFGEILPVFIFIVAWAFAWSIASKLVTHKFYFAFHAMLVSLVICGFYLIEPVFEYIEFLFPITHLAERLTLITDFTLPAILLYGHFRQSTTLSKKVSRNAAIATSFTVVGVFHLIAWINQPEFSNRPEFSTALKAPVFNRRTPDSIERFFADVAPLSKFTIEKTDTGQRDEP